MRKYCWNGWEGPTHVTIRAAGVLEHFVRAVRPPRQHVNAACEDRILSQVSRVGDVVVDVARELVEAAARRRPVRERRFWFGCGAATKCQSQDGSNDDPQDHGNDQAGVSHQRLPISWLTTP
jgi:hypothetical protein